MKNKINGISVYISSSVVNAWVPKQHADQERARADRAENFFAEEKARADRAENLIAEERARADRSENLIAEERARADQEKARSEVAEARIQELLMQINASKLENSM
jgi:hypothetical protein